MYRKCWLLWEEKYKLAVLSAGEMATVWGLEPLGHSLHVCGILLPCCLQFTFASTFL